MTSGSVPGTPGSAGRSLHDWLAYIESRHPKAIDMGLERVREVAGRLSLLKLPFPVITVGGTNGKGSTCAMLETMLASAGHRTGCYTSPHLVHYNERVRVDRRQANDEELCDAFEAVENARGDITLTYFEFGTLAAVRHFIRMQVDVAILEVGLGGRLDAVNVFDADCAVVTSVGIDHTDYLGTTRESIGFEKAGISRGGRPAVIGDPEPPDSLVRHALDVGAILMRAGADFRGVIEEGQWRYEGPGGLRAGLPFPALRGAYQVSNAAVAITALDTLRDRIPVSAGALREGLLAVSLPGRFQVLAGRPSTILDVAHNPHAARAFAQTLGQMERARRTVAVFGMLQDKDIAAVVRELRPHVDCWNLAPLPGVRGASVDILERALDDAGVLDEIRRYDDVASAFDAARAEAHADDRILVIGSFLTVSQALASLSRRDH